jgi:hypothetical protein
MKNCKFAGTTKCPFDDSDQGPPFAGSVKSCDLFNPRFFCRYFEDMKNADAIYARNVAGMDRAHKRHTVLESEFDKFFDKIFSAFR